MLKNKIDDLLAYIRDHNDFIEKNCESLDIFEGNLEKYVLADLQKSLSSEYFEKIKTRVIPVNILTRLIDKLSKVYALKPVREVLDESAASDKELLEYYETKLNMNHHGNMADEYSNLFKAYAWEPFLHKGTPKLRTLPFDRFLVYSDDKIDPTELTIFIKMIGKRPIRVEDKRHADKYRTEFRSVYYAYTDEEFIAFDSEGEIYEEAMSETEEGENPYGVIPFFYGNRAKSKLIPVQDSDLIRMTKVIPIMFSDISGAILFQCFSIIWGVDIDFENMVISPNGLWSLRSVTDPNGDKTTPQVGTLKPEADIDKVANFVMTVFIFWLETKGIKVGSIGQVNGANVASGIAKIIDELDVTEIKKIQIERFKKEEKEFWQLLKAMHNTWVETGKIEGVKKFSDNFEVNIEFDEPEPNISRKEKVENVDLEVSRGYLPPEDALKELYPDDPPEETARKLAYFMETRGNNNGSTENDDSNSERLLEERKESDSPRNN